MHNSPFILRNVTIFLVLLLALASCREEVEIFIPEEVEVTQPEYTSVTGFYLLNEANMNSNDCSLDYYDYAHGRYMRNIYATRNPRAVKDLGDVGNDIGIYGSRLYAVINCSNKVEVMDLRARRIGQVDVPNCRYIKFHGGYAYLTSYAGPVAAAFDGSYKQYGYVAKIDTATLQVVDTCVVGFQPDQLDIVGDKIYVTNSGGYMVPNYENTLSVIDLHTFEEVERIPLAINLHLCQADHRGILWVSSRGDYGDNPSRLFAYDTRKHRLVQTLDVAVSNMWMDGDSLYIIGNQWSNITQSTVKSYAIVNTRTMQQVSDRFITDGTDAEIAMPYGIAVNPITKDIYVTDAKNYVTPGRLYCFGSDGVLKWDVLTGYIPAHFVFVGENINEN
ncbi:MAG: YncE family protein [Muribaculaceae bacterium]|nr:YncE family protein [Muribaculaceae bacterium]